MNALIIGGTNFMGPFVARELSKSEHAITLFHRSSQKNNDGYTHIQGDCANVGDLRIAIKKAEPDVLIHMVAYFGSHSAALEQALE